VGIVNRIGEPEQERLGLFTEEAGEVQLEIGKILRHGIDSHHPNEPGLSNAQRLELEAGHVLAAIDLLVACGTLSADGLERSRGAKLQKLRSWLHCGTNLDAVDELLKSVGPASSLLRGDVARHALAPEPDNLLLRVAGFLSLVARGLVPMAEEHQREAAAMLDEIGARMTAEWPETRPEPRHAEGGE
jgi:hypothetical protein